MRTYRIMSNNIWRCDENNAAWAAVGANCSAETRLEGLFRVYAEKEPDILGLQECSPHMADLLMRRFSEKHMPYALIWGKDTPILYRTDRFELQHTEFSIYPKSIPGLPGSFNNSLTKSYCIAVLREKQGDERLIFATTHLWWKSSDLLSKEFQLFSDEARAVQMCALLKRLSVLEKEYACPVVVVGDMNAVYASAAIQAALKRGYRHAHDVASEYADETYGMHYCYPDRYDTTPYEGGFQNSIDHILVRGDIGVKRFERYAPDYYMPVSDHFPVWIDAKLCEEA